MDAFRRSVDISRKDRVRNDEIRRLMVVDGNVFQELHSRQLTWYGHDNRRPKQAMQWKPA